MTKQNMKPTAGQLAGAVAVITGASSGIGKAIALLFAEEGAAVIIVHHDDLTAANDVVKSVANAGGKAVAVAADVRRESDVANVFEVTNSAFGTATILVNSAGIDAAGITVSDMELDHFEDVLRTNLVGPFLFCRAFVRGLKDRKNARIINISSVHEEIPRAGAADYCASKGGLKNLTRCLALELAERGITVNSLAPGMILTPMNQVALDDPKELDREVQSIPMKRAGQPEEIAKLALYLASETAAYATGATFTLDGGLQLNLGQGA